MKPETMTVHGSTDKKTVHYHHRDILFITRRNIVSFVWSFVRRRPMFFDFLRVSLSDLVAIVGAVVVRVRALTLVVLETEGGLEHETQGRYSWVGEHCQLGAHLVTFNHSPAGIIKYLEMRKGFHRVKVLQHRSKEIYIMLRGTTAKMEFGNFRRKSHNCFPLKFVGLSVAVCKDSILRKKSSDFCTIFGSDRRLGSHQYHQRSKPPKLGLVFSKILTT